MLAVSSKVFVGTQGSGCGMFLALLGYSANVPTATPTKMPTECPAGEKKLKTEVKK